jgi:hypothetical protein
VVQNARPRQSARNATSEGGGAVRAAVETAEAPPQGPPPSAPVKQESDVRVVDIAEDTVSLRGYSQDRLKFEVSARIFLLLSSF